MGQFSRLLCRIYKTKLGFVSLSLSYVNAENNLPYVETNQKLPIGVWILCTY